MVTMRYDAAGRRVELDTRPNGGSTTTTTFRYQGDAIAQELTGTGTPTVTRTYVTDEAGGIVKFCDPDCTGSNPQYMVTWNGHGDATAIWKIDTSTGALTLANDFTYTTWGAPTTTTHNSIADLGFRFLYVGRQGVAWDNSFGLGLEYMGARHYSPTLGRFLQPDPSAADANLYAYAQENPVTNTDPSGLCIGPLVFVCLWGVGDVVIGAGGLLLAWWAGSFGSYLYNHPVHIQGRSGGYSWAYLLSRQDKKLTPGDIGVLKRRGIDPEELKGGKHTGQWDLWKKPNGDIVIKPKNGSGPGEPTGVNLNRLVFGRSPVRQLTRMWGWY